jgi:hypothetical protein
MGESEEDQEDRERISEGGVAREGLLDALEGAGEGSKTGTMLARLDPRDAERFLAA